MTTEIKYPTPAELRAYELQARELRAETMRAGIKAAFRMPKAALAAVRHWAARPAHA